MTHLRNCSKGRRSEGRTEGKEVWKQERKESRTLWKGQVTGTCINTRSRVQLTMSEPPGRVGVFGPLSG